MSDIAINTERMMMVSIEAIELQFRISELELIRFMRARLKKGCFKLWRARVSGRVTQHTKLKIDNVGRGYCPTQYKHR
jgi:uncharacterized protein (TIGR03643 family)